MCSFGVAFEDNSRHLELKPADCEVKSADPGGVLDGLGGVNLPFSLLYTPNPANRPVCPAWR